MKKITIERIVLENGDVVLHNRKAKLMCILTSEYQMIGFDDEFRPRSFVRKGKLTPEAKRYIDAKPKEWDFIVRLLQ